MMLNNLDPKHKNGVGGYFAKRTLKNLNIPHFPVPGNTFIDGKKFYYHDARCFYDTYKEIFERKMYQFKTNQSEPLILDCGANMGLSVLFFSMFYPTAKIIAFEPEKAIFEVLQKNIDSFNLTNVTALEKAVWINNDDLTFYTDTGMGGSVTNVYSNQTPTIIKTEVLADYLQQPVAFLKMDIEGAEVEVIKHCAPLLKNVENIFVEYHSYVDKKQELDNLLQIMKDSGFRYHLSQSFSYTQPFIENTLACENMDLAINIFGYRSK